MAGSEPMADPGRSAATTLDLTIDPYESLLTPMAEPIVLRRALRNRSRQAIAQMTRHRNGA